MTQSRTRERERLGKWIGERIGKEEERKSDDGVNEGREMGGGEEAATEQNQEGDVERRLVEQRQDRKVLRKKGNGERKRLGRERGEGDRW